MLTVINQHRNPSLDCQYGINGVFFARVIPITLAGHPWFPVLYPFMTLALNYKKENVQRASYSSTAHTVGELSERLTAHACAGNRTGDASVRGDNVTITLLRPFCRLYNLK